MTRDLRLLAGAVLLSAAGDLLATADGNGCTYLWQISPRAT